MKINRETPDLNDDIPPPKYYDCARTCNTTPSCNKNDTTTSRPPVPKKGGCDPDLKSQPLIPMRPNCKPPDDRDASIDPTNNSNTNSNCFFVIAPNKNYITSRLPMLNRQTEDDQWK